MKIGKLTPQRRKETKKLYQEVFSEDSQKFVDYYYKEKAAENTIFAAEEEGEGIVSMVHLNPYRVRLLGKEAKAHYIVAVATRASFRRRGLMGRLLKAAMEEMYREKEPFTFLMPAAEAIYAPYDFRFIYRQNQQIWEKEKDVEKKGLMVRKAAPEDDKALEAFWRGQVQEKYQACAIHDEGYWSLLRKEQESQNGGIGLVYLGETLKGCFFYAKEDTTEVRELEVERDLEEATMAAVMEFLSTEKVKVSAFPPCLEKANAEQVPMIMARIVHAETLLSYIRAAEPIEFSLGLRDPWLPENTAVYHCRADREGCQVTKEPACQGEYLLEAGDLIQMFFGWKKPKELGISGGLLEALEKVLWAEPAFFNEIV